MRRGGEALRQEDASANHRGKWVGQGLNPEEPRRVAPEQVLSFHARLWEHIFKFSLVLGPLIMTSSRRYLDVISTLFERYDVILMLFRRYSDAI